MPRESQHSILQKYKLYVPKFFFSPILQCSYLEIRTSDYFKQSTDICCIFLVSATTHPTKGKGSKFDAGSFVGGIVLTLGVLSILYIGCKMYYSRRGIRYRSM
jgi:hypothetical protein